MSGCDLLWSKKYVPFRAAMRKQLPSFQRPTARRQVLERRGASLRPHLCLPKHPSPVSTKLPPAPPHASSIACALPPALSQGADPAAAAPSVAASPVFAARSPSTFILSVGAAALAARGAKLAHSSSPQLPCVVRGELLFSYVCNNVCNNVLRCNVLRTTPQPRTPTRTPHVQKTNVHIPGSLNPKP